MSSENKKKKATRSSERPVVFSPKKAKVESIKSDVRDSVFARIVTDTMGIIGSYSAKNCADDAFLAYAGNLAKDSDGLFTKKKGDQVVKSIKMENLRAKGIVDYKHRRVDVDNDNILRSTQLNGFTNKHWSRHVFVVMSSQKLDEELWMALIIAVIEVSTCVTCVDNKM